MTMKHVSIVVMAIAIAGLAGRFAMAQQPADKTARLLVDVIRVNTSNPPGHEGQIAELLASKFKPLGFEIEIVPTPEAGKAAFFARLNDERVSLESLRQGTEAIYRTLVEVAGKDAGR